MAPEPPPSSGGPGSEPPTAPDSREALLRKIGRFPAAPGVYLMKDSRGRIIYIGKAVNLRSRVRSYFSGSSDGRVFHAFISERARDVDCIVTAGEGEALLLENNLIKKHRPSFNIRLKDDKAYVSLKVTLDEEWPRVLVVRRWKQDGALYFGPYSSAGSVREVLRVIKTVFPLRTCSNGFFRSRTRPCLEHDLGRCTAPCVGAIARERYLQDVEEVVLFLRGRNQDLLERLRRKMEAAAAERRYELAARYRDQIEAMEKVFESQQAEGLSARELDVFATHRQGDAAAIEELLVRDGKIVHSRCHSFRSPLPTAEILGSFLAQYYLEGRWTPREVVCEIDFPDRGLLAASLSARRGSGVEVVVPRRGEKLELVELARRNAENAFQLERTRSERMRLVVDSLGRLLGMSGPPSRIECFDISNLQGAHSVASMVRFEDGEPARDRYRKFRIRTVAGADDFRSMAEVIRRRLSRGLADGDLPDLILVDGGKGQLSAAGEVFRELGVSGVALAALAKERRRRGTEERIFVPERAEPLPIPPEAPESLYLQGIRDEAHRFAIRYHRELRRRRTLASGLEGIPGVGAARRRLLIERFRTLDGMRSATVAEIASVVGPELAERVRAHLLDPPAEE